MPSEAAPDFALLFNCAPTPLMVMRADDPAFTFVAVNDAFLESSGMSRPQLIGFDVFDVFPKNPDASSSGGPGDLLAAFRRVIASRVPERLPEYRYDVKRPQGAEPGFDERHWRATIVPVFGADGKVEYLYQWIEQVTDIIRAERQRRAGEKRFRQLAENASLGIIIADDLSRVSYLNPAALQIIGYTEEEIVSGAVFWPGLTPPEMKTRDEEAVRELIANGRCAPYEKAYIAKDGRRVPVLVSAGFLEPIDGKRQIAAFMFDLSERKQSRRDAFLVSLDDATRRLEHPREIAHKALRLLREHLRADRCGYAIFDADEDSFTLVWDTKEDAPPERSSLTQSGAEAARLMRANLPLVMEDVETDGRFAEFRDAHRKTHVAAKISVPLQKDGRLVAVIGVYTQQPRRWLADEVELVQAVANRAWESLERARVSEALQASEWRLRVAQAAAKIGTFEWFIPENRIVWTPELEALYGLAEGSFEGKLDDWSKRVAPEDASRVIAGISECLSRNEAEYTYEFRAVMPDGSLRWLRGKAQFLYDNAGRAERMLGVNIDIDSHKRAESDLYQQWRTFDTALSHTPDFAYTFDRDGRFTYVNRALLSLWQLELKDALGKNFFDLQYPEDLAGQLQTQIQEVVDMKHPVRDTTPFTGPTGETRYYEYIFVPVLSTDGAVEAVAGTTRDITEGRQAEARERERQEQLRESARLESLGVMAGGIAHDFNNLLVGILGNTSLAAEMLPPSHPARESVQAAIHASERAADLTGQMLAYSGKGRFVLDVLDLNTLVRDNLTLLRASLARNVSVGLELGRDGCFVEVDRAQLQQVIMNLLINASEAVGDRPGRVSIRTGMTERLSQKFSAQLQALVPAGKFAFFEVQDDGSGMTSETLRRIFDPFFTTKFTGRGLGLAAVLGIVKSHGGDIEVESVIGSGTTFRILLPVSLRPESVRNDAPLVPVAATGQTILVVDDEEIVRNMARKALERRGFQVIPAGDGAQALQALQKHPEIALVILDLTMPVMTGEQALPLIRERHPATPVILSSGFSEAEVSERFAEAGIAAFLQKPYTTGVIAAKVTEALQLSEPRVNK